MIGKFFRARVGEATSGGGYVFVGQGIYQIAMGDYIGGGFSLLAGLVLFLVPEGQSHESVTKILEQLSDADLDERLRRYRDKR